MVGIELLIGKLFVSIIFGILSSTTLSPPPPILASDLTLRVGVFTNTEMVPKPHFMIRNRSKKLSQLCTPQETATLAILTTFISLGHSAIMLSLKLVNPLESTFAFVFIHFPAKYN